jgi:hypothetical protein
MKKYALSLLTLSMAFSSGFAVAEAGVAGMPAERSVDLTFSTQGIVTHTLEAKSFLQAGQVTQGTLFANGAVTTAENGGVLLYFSNHTESVTTGQAQIYGKFAGKNDPNNSITVSLEVPSLTGFKDHNGTKALLQTRVDNEYTYKLHSGPSPKNIVADTYVVKVVAHAWQE